MKRQSGRAPAKRCRLTMAREPQSADIDCRHRLTVLLLALCAIHVLSSVFNLVHLIVRQMAIVQVQAHAAVGRGS